MSKINAVRLININYNNNAIRISDECFHMNGESTLMSLQNGGGKSVLVQMLTAPFVHKRHRNTKDRPFESYFTTSKPSFILVEWVLDQGAGFVLTGMMVRKSQAEVEEKEENLEIVTIISEYKEPCIQDIYHLPVVEKGKKEMILKNFGACRQLFDSYKRDPQMEFFCYDMGNAAQSRQYFDKLMEYQIHYKEWETIIKKVNLKESGLSELFSECKDEKGLVEKWFLEAIENKLNKERDRIKEFQLILEKYVGQYKDNRSKIERRDTIRIFREQAVSIEEKGKWYRELTEELKKQENKIACFIQELNRCHEVSEKEYQQILGQIEAARLEIAQMEYERLSSEFYKQEEMLRFHTSNRDMIEMEKENLEREAKKIENMLHLLICAKQQEEAAEWETEFAKAKQKLLVYRKKEEDLEPERNFLGYRLKCYYSEKLQENEENIDARKNELEEVLTDIQTRKAEIENLEEEIQKLLSKEGGLKIWLESYGQQESTFNDRYKENISRNILGVYEPGTLEICQDVYTKELEKEIRKGRESKKRLEGLRGKQKGLERKLDDQKEERIKKQAEHEKHQKQLEDYEEELKKRRIVLKYLNMGEESLFEREEILKELEKKLLEISGIKRKLEKEENELLKEYEQLLTGKMMELPKELEDKLTELGINIVYGMEWLKKNGYAEAENQELVRQNPFLPYALILSKQELERIAEHAGSIYTSFPVPIILREQLKAGNQEAADGIVKLSGVSFYVLFNEALLNEEKLQCIINDNLDMQKKKRDAIWIREQEYREYFERKELVKNQKVDAAKYDEVKENLDTLEKQMHLLETELDNGRKELKETKELIEAEENAIRESEKQVDYQKRRLEDFEALKEAYHKYEENQKLLEKCQKEKKRFQENQKLTKDLLERQQKKQKTLEIAIDFLTGECDVFGKCYQRYQDYEEMINVPENLKRELEEKISLEEKDLDAKEVVSAQITELEARYEAITAHISQELKELEQQAQTAGEKYRKAWNELDYLQKKYKLAEKAWLTVSYNRKEEIHQESILEECQRKIEKKQALWNEEDKRIAVIDNEKKKYLHQIQKNCQKEAPIPKEKIQSQDFEAKKKQLEHQKSELEEQADAVLKQIQSYDENLTALAEYSEIPVKEEGVLEQRIEKMDSRELRNFKGILIRDYNSGIKELQNAKEQLAAVLQRMLRMEQFQEDFYKKPLESMLEVSKDARQVLLQLDTTLKAYDSLMEKLEVDISLVEKEKEKIAELLEDYTHEVHDNLGKIDSNSTIVVREKPIKMLKIQIPDWEENAALYQLRLNDFIDKITLRGVEIFERNENAQEYFGTRITTKNLYDTVIGLGNVQIRLYKIEAQREYPITWAEVARNSGGEGFLSAFVILSSLLYYMRKDDTDIFAEKNEGKVLLMDNPFAQTNASHLLKPLMDIAKKANTQLICFTGLGGESIYNRFDNIYVLNLIAASLKNGMQYLRSEHLRGTEPDTLEIAQIEVMEQQELIF